MFEELHCIESIGNIEQLMELPESQKEALSTIMPDVLGPEFNTPEFKQEIIDNFDFNVECLHPQWETAINLSALQGRGPVWDDFLRQLSPEFLEAPVDKVQWSTIGEELCNVEDVRIERWQELSLDERLEVLQRIENAAALAEHRPACEVKMRTLDSNVNGHFLPGDGITINASRLKGSADSQESLDSLLETLIHEGRHAYQHYNISTRMVHSSPAEVAQWRENWPNYFDGESIEMNGLHVRTKFLRQTGFRLYYYQPVETDARRFAADTLYYFKSHRNF